MIGGFQMEKRVYTIEEVAELLCISKSYVYKLVRNNKIPNLTLGKRKLIPIDKFNKWLETKAKSQLL